MVKYNNLIDSDLNQEIKEILINRLEKFVHHQYEGQSNLYEWLDNQQLATRAGFSVFTNVLQEYNKDKLLNFIANELSWEEFDDVIHIISNNLILYLKNRGE